MSDPHRIRRAPLPLLALLLLPVSALAAETGRPPIDLQGVRVVDLTYAFDDKTLYWPTAPSTFDLERFSYGKTEAGFFYAANSFCTPEHGGTHLDAPIHFAAGKRTADQIPPEQLIAPPWSSMSAHRRRPTPTTA